MYSVDPANAIPCGWSSPSSSVDCSGAAPGFGVSLTIWPVDGSETRRAPSGVHVSSRAFGTRAHTPIVHPCGIIARRGWSNGVWAISPGTFSGADTEFGEPGAAAGVDDAGSGEC